MEAVFPVPRRPLRENQRPDSARHLSRAQKPDGRAREGSRAGRPGGRRGWPTHLDLAAASYALCRQGAGAIPARTTHFAGRDMGGRYTEHGTEHNSADRSLPRGKCNPRQLVSSVVLYYGLVREFWRGLRAAGLRFSTSAEYSILTSMCSSRPAQRNVRGTVVNALRSQRRYRTADPKDEGPMHRLLLGVLSEALRAAVAMNAPRCNILGGNYWKHLINAYEGISYFDRLIGIYPFLRPIGYVWHLVVS